MTKRLSISKDDVQKRSDKTRTIWKRVAIGITIFITLVIIGNLIGYVNNQLSIRKSQSIVASTENEVARITSQWNEALKDCSINMKASNNLQMRDEDPHVSILIDYPISDLKYWTNNKGFTELDCFTKIIFGIKLSQRVNFQKDIPQAGETLYLNENLIPHDPDGSQAGGLWGAIYLSEYTQDTIGVQFHWDLPAE